MKSKGKFITLLIFSSLFFLACSGEKRNTQSSSTTITTSEEITTQKPINDGHTSELSLDWFGVYQGMIPCDNCDGIKIRIALTKDYQFTRSMTYLGMNDDPLIENGEFEWNDEGNIITLKGVEDGYHKFFVGENVLTQLDPNGKVIKGEKADKYRLRQNASDWRIENKKWVLSELMGNPVEPTEAGKESWIKMDVETGTATGNNSCNSFILQYDLLRGNRISFSKGATTLMACPDMETSEAFMQVLEKTDNYSLSEDGTLTFNKAKMAPMARFKAAE